MDQIFQRNLSYPTCWHWTAASLHPGQVHDDKLI